MSRFFGNPEDRFSRDEAHKHNKQFAQLHDYIYFCKTYSYIIIMPPSFFHNKVVLYFPHSVAIIDAFVRFTMADYVSFI